MKPATEPPALIELRGPSGRLYGMLDCRSLVIEFKTGRAGSHTERQCETVDLKPYLEAAKLIDRRKLLG